MKRRGPKVVAETCIEQWSCSSKCKKTVLFGIVDLSFGTICYGTIIPNQKFFVAEDIFLYKNKDVSTYNNISKLKLLSKIFSDEIKQISYMKNDIIMSLPITKISYNELECELKFLPYKIYSIAFIKGKQANIKYIYKYKEKQIHTAIFKITADIQNNFSIHSVAVAHLSPR